ncbi:MAG TPA: DUF962 domain-containing protein [Polyangiaceae bacterium]|jgi:hypothetical protein|nr:DUF962 domain-containing protein [Polyangiaceae bacterium]
METEKSDFDAFWLEYVREHSHPLNRKLHMIGMSLALACFVAGVLKRRVSLLLLAPVFGYGFAWFGHFFVEKNTPQSFSHPLYSLRASAILYWKTLCGEMEAEIERAQQGDTSAEPRREEAAAAEVN